MSLNFKQISPEEYRPTSINCQGFCRFCFRFQLSAAVLCLCLERCRQPLCPAHYSLGSGPLPSLQQPHPDPGQPTVPGPQPHCPEVRADVHTVHPPAHVPRDPARVRRLHQRRPECAEGICDGAGRHGTIQ